MWSKLILLVVKFFTQRATINFLKANQSGVFINTMDYTIPNIGEDVKF